MPAPRRPWQAREAVSARRTRIRSAAGGASVAVLVLGVATAGSVTGIVSSNRQHGVTRAAAAVLDRPSTSSSSSESVSPVSAEVDPPTSVTTAAPVAGTPAAGLVPVVAATKPNSQGMPGVVPVPLAPRAVAGPIPLLAWQAYHFAAAGSGCNLPWYLLAGIGKIESDHGRFAGAHFDVAGTVHPAIYGPPTAYGRAMGPMQFIPPTWASYATDGNSDGKTDPQNIFDATAAAAHYLCNAGGTDLSGLPAQSRAVFAYNHLDSYVADVLAFAAAYQHGRSETTVALVPIQNQQPVHPSSTARARTTSPAAPTSASHSAPATSAPTTSAPATAAPTSSAPTSSAPASSAPTSSAPATSAPVTATTTARTTTSAPTTSAPTTTLTTTSAPTTTSATTTTSMSRTAPPTASLSGSSPKPTTNPPPTTSPATDPTTSPVASGTACVTAPASRQPSGVTSPGTSPLATSASPSRPTYSTPSTGSAPSSAASGSTSASACPVCPAPSDAPAPTPTDAVPTPCASAPPHRPTPTPTP